MGGDHSKIYLPTDAPLDCDYSNRREISHGAYGSIHEACCNSDCSYISKIQTIGKGIGEISEASFRKEVRIQNYLAKHNIAPKIYGAWIEGNSGIIVMGRLAHTAEQAYKLGIYPKDKISQDVTNVITKLHELGIIHKDLHGGNLMYDEKGNLFIIDFGLSIESAPEDSKYRYLRLQDHKRFLKTLG